MRRHTVSTMYIICMYLFFENISFKRTCKENKTFMHRVISHYNILRIVEDISMDTKTDLNN